MNTKMKILSVVLGSMAASICLVVAVHVLDRDTSHQTSSEPRQEANQAKPASSRIADMPPASADSSRNEQEQKQPRSPNDRQDPFDRGQRLFERLGQKIESQGDVATFFDNQVLAALQQEKPPQKGDQLDRFCSLVEQLQESKQNRFCSYKERINDLCPLTGLKRSLLPQDFMMSQGTHSVVKWKQYDVFKTSFDFVIYWMLMDEIKPQLIVELGSGPGGSAIWFADMASALGFETQVYSYDIKKPDISYPNVEFIEYDLQGISSHPLPFKERFTGTKLVTEDAHVNLKNVLLEIDSFLSTGDYLIIEDSFNKQKEIAEFLELTDKNYQLDRYYLDFFGKNGSSSIDSIFKVF